MGIQIQTVAFPTDDKALEIDNCSAVRALDVGTDWTELFVAFSLVIDCSVANPTTGSRILLGVSNSLGFDDSSVKFAGVGIKASQAWADNTDYLTVTGGASFTSKIGATETSASSFGTWSFTKEAAVGSGQFVNPNGFALWLQKASGTINVAVIGAVNSGGGSPLTSTRNFSKSRLTLAAEAGNYSDAATIIGVSAASGSLSVSDVNQALLNAVCLYWNRSTSLAKVLDVVIAKWA